MPINIKQSITDPPAIDPGNMEIQGRTVSKTIHLGMFSTNENAVWGANNQLRKESYPFGALKISVNRRAFRHEVGDCFKWNYSPYSVSQMICRVLGKSEEAIESEKIIITAMEDVFSAGSMVETYAEPVDHSIPRPDYTVSPFVHQAIIETPYVMVGEKIALLPMACRESDLDLGFEVWMSIDGGASYFYVDTIANIRPYGTLAVAYSNQTYTIDEQIGITVDFHNNDVSQVEAATWSEVLSGQKNTVIIFQAGGVYEIISFKDITPIAGLQYKLENVIRGRYGTEKLNHSVGEDFYIINMNASIVENEEILPGVSRKFKFIPYNSKQIGDISDCIALTLAITGVAFTPYKPKNFCANGSSFASRYDTNIILTWSPRYRGKGSGVGIFGVNLPDSDREGLFSVEVWVEGIKVRTTNVIDAATWTYTEAMNLEDNGSLADKVLFKLSNYLTEAGIVYESDQAEVTCLKNLGGLS